MLPGTTISPPARFNPRRRPCESRPLRDEPPAFLCAMSGLLAGANAGDAQNRHRLTMAVLAAIVVAAPFLEHQDLVAELVLEHFGGDRRAGDQRHASLRLLALAAEHENLVERHARTRLAGEFFDKDYVVLDDSVL